jgi:hypothetical protein
MTDNHRQRAWVKIQLAATITAHEAAQQVRQWKSQRQAAPHIVRAIRLYAALCRGELSLLQEYFPGLFLALGTPTTVKRLAPPAVAPAVPVGMVSRSQEDELSQALDGLGLDHLEFE